MEALFLLLEFFGQFLLELLLSLFFEGAVELSGHKLKKSRKKRHAARGARAQDSGKQELESEEPESEELESEEPESEELETQEPELPEPFSWVISVFVYFVLGLVSGFISLLAFPDSFIKSGSARLISLFAAPIAAGMVMSLVGRVRDKNGEEPIRLDNFFYGFLFALAMTLMRYYLAA
ncbi:MAG: hypothetical protein CVV41_06120 [Candidatus Riflebacteria bacterium HGW-Riflebacteria-1]|nr:MAG: hypothetical protein CVV41_06120 [Candidatus Riflebacteria bacterium HGW-Riflebacteria-1]